MLPYAGRCLSYCQGAGCGECLFFNEVYASKRRDPSSTIPTIDRKKIKGKIVEDYRRDRAAYGNKKALAYS